MTDSSIASPVTLAYLRLSMTQGLSPVLINRLVSYAGDADRACRLSAAQLSEALSMEPDRGQMLTSAIAAVDLQDVLADCRRLSLQIISPGESLWPLALRQMLDPPPVLFIRGALLPDDTVAVAIVGARQCTLYGREQAEKFARGLAQAGLTIISGGARGIDTAAHYGALRAGGRTIVVSGCGLGHCYPPENDGLYDDIINRQAGCIISEMPPDEPPLPRNFPPRNRIIAALSLGTLVVEANLRSGSMITARLAAEDYGRDVFAVPGRVDSPASSGTHHLIRIGGAELVESANDILATLGLLTADPAAATVSAAEAEVPSARPFAGRRQSSSAEPESPDKLRRRPAADNRHEDPTGQHTSHRGKQKKSPEVSTVPAETDVPPEPTLFSAPQEKILSAIGGKEPLGIDALCQETALPAAVVMAELTMLELRGLIRRTADRTFTRA